MRTKRHFFRTLSLAAVLALLLSLPFPPPAAANAGSALESVGRALGNAASAMVFSGSRYDREIYSDRAVSPEEVRAAVSREIRDRSLFIADVEPGLCGAGLVCSPLLPPWERESFRAANLLWRLALSPEALRRAKEALLDTGVPSARRLDNLEETVDELYAAAGIFWEAIEGLSKSSGRTSFFPFRSDTLNGRVETQQALAPYLPFAGRHLPALTAVTDEYGLEAHSVFRAAWLLRDAPEKADAFLAIMNDRSLPPERRNTLATRLPGLAASAENDPDALFAALLASMRVEDMYTIMTYRNFDLESVALPLASILPQAAERIEAKGSVPLNAGGEGPAPGVLTSRVLEELVPEDLLDAMRDTGFSGKAPALPFLREGETLYAVVDPGEPDAIPVFSPEGPLGLISGAGPVILPYNARTAETFGMLLDSPRTVPLFAARGVPRDLADHLAGLSVMLTERERSLYGAFEEYASTPDAEFLKRMNFADITPEKVPADLPGRHPRFIDFLDPLFIPTLAEHADAAGLARLMGPIRAVWVPSWSPAPGTDGVFALWDIAWTEYRYAPGADPAVSSLGEAPVLELDTPVLEALRQKHAAAVRIHTEQSLASQECFDRKNEEDAPACGELYTVMQGAASASYWALERLGFKSPLELHSITYALVYLRNDAKAFAAMLDVLRGSAQTPAAKAAEITDIFNAARKAAASPAPTAPTAPATSIEAPAEAVDEPPAATTESAAENAGGTPDAMPGVPAENAAKSAPGTTPDSETAPAGEEASSPGSARPGAQRENTQPASRYGSWDDGIGPNVR